MFYPQNVKCAVCGRDLFDNNDHGICSGCLPKANVRFCLKCGRAIGGESDYCDDCGYGRDFVEARAPFLFEGNAKKLVYGLKYGGHKYIAKIIASFLAEEYNKLNWNVDAIAFVPMHSKRLKSRGYNQAELIADELSKIVNLPLNKTLIRTKFSDNFAKLTRKERFSEAESSFEAIARNDDKNILLVDDVFTTGATTGGCAKALLRSGAKNIYVLTFCTSKCKTDLF